jgi:hypothetical protein
MSHAHVRAAAGWIALLALAGCGVSEAQYPKQYGAAACSRLKECAEDAFDALYADGKQECVDDIAAIIETALDAGDLLNQTYSPAKAADCVNGLATASCDDIQGNTVACDVFE